MGKKEKEFAAVSLLLIELIIKYGPSVAVSIMKTLEPTDITPEKIRALMVKPPEHYFEGENS